MIYKLFLFVWSIVLWIYMLSRIYIVHVIVRSKL